MVKVAVSGMPGRLASAVAQGIAASEDFELGSLFNPRRVGDTALGHPIVGSHDEVEADAVFEATEPDVVIDNLRAWRSAGMAAVVGTSGFTADRIAMVRDFWDEDGPGCLIVPNFSIGAVLMMRFAEIAAPHFTATEIIERHHDDKPDAPSGTSIATAGRIAKARGASIEKSREIVDGARGAQVEGVRIHSLRLEATLSDQEVALSRPGELLSVRHIGTSYGSFVDGALLALRYVGEVSGVEVGLDRALEWAAGQ